MTSRKRARGFLYIVYLIIVTPILLEIVVRIWGYSERYIYDPIYMQFPSSADIPFVHKPFLVNARARSTTWFSTDSLGLRSAVPQESASRKNPFEYRIAVVGNSTTFGQGVCTEETFCFLLTQNLHEMRDLGVRSFNFGVSGYSVKEMAATVEHRVFAVDPNLILICISFEDFDTTRCGGVDQWGYNVSYRLNHDMDKNSLLKRVLRPIHLAYIARDVKYLFERKNVPQKSSPHGLAFSISPSYRFVQEMKRIARGKGIPFLLVLLPTSGWSGAQFDETLKLCRTDSIDVLNLSQIGGDIPPAQFNLSKYDSHPSALVHDRMAEMITTYLTEYGAALSSLFPND